MSLRRCPCSECGNPDPYPEERCPEEFDVAHVLSQCASNLASVDNTLWIACARDTPQGLDVAGIVNCGASPGERPSLTDLRGVFGPFDSIVMGVYRGEKCEVKPEDLARLVEMVNDARSGNAESSIAVKGAYLLGAGDAVLSIMPADL